MSRAIADMLNLGPAMQRWLAEIGVGNEDELRTLGSIEAYQRLRFALGPKVTRNALYAMEAALLDCPWRELPEQVKARLRVATDPALTARRTSRKR